jgi:predicted NUDIX family NTP pyrophosphohydrolase
MAKVSAGIVLYRRDRGRLEVLLVHPGGPFWAKKDAGAWSIPKGEAETGEDLLARARTELREETGVELDVPFVALAPVKQRAKMVHAWAAEAAVDVAPNASNLVEIEYPPRSGRKLRFPEVDRAEWFDVDTAREKLLEAQRPLLDQVAALATR